jgi:hypothetical protein
MTALDRVAVVSDVQGNLTAFQAVLADIDAAPPPLRRPLATEPHGGGDQGGHVHGPTPPDHDHDHDHPDNDDDDGPHDDQGPGGGHHH